MTPTLSRRPVVAFGPELPGTGSWDWIGHDLMQELAARFDVRSFRDELPACDVAVIVKWHPPLQRLQRGAHSGRLIFCPVDLYGSSADIDADWRFLRACQCVIVHCPQLAKYFRSYAPVELLDHHVKFVAPPREELRDQGSIFWAGVWSNLPPLVEWVQQHGLPGRLHILTNLEGRERASPEEFGFDSQLDVTINNWSTARHIECLSQARAAIDVKGTDFRQRHKPASKAIDYIASGVPLAMNAGSSSVHYLRHLGFEVADPRDVGRWFSPEYWRATQAFGSTLRAQLSRAAVARRMADVIERALQQREAA